jgi:hydrophobic/amphiphilic exporter-1 (mainly G- bacteria), HAE1 family
MNQNKQSSAWSFFINRLPITWLLTIGIILIGVFATTVIPREVQPEVKIPIGAVTTALPGANPADIESLITEPLEKEIASIEDIETLSSTSSLGISTIVVEFDADADLKEAVQELKDKVDIAKTELPEDATEPLVVKAEANSTAIVNFSIIGDRPLSELTKIAEDIQEELEKLSGVSKASIVGEQVEEIQVKIDPLKAESYGINIQEISNAIKLGNYNLPLGIISTDKVNYSVRIDNLYQNIDEIRKTPIRKTQGENPTTILIKDLATVEKVFKEKSNISKLSIEGGESKQAVTVQIFKKSGGNVIDIVDTSKEKVEELKADLPDDIQIATTNDFSEFIRTDLGILTQSGIQTTLLIILILFLALGFVEGLLAGLSIPLTLLATVAILQAEGMTINGLTLFSMVIALGLMVDTAIVIMEGVHENIKKGVDSKQAAINSVQTYKWPLIAGTLTTIFAFFPMLLVSGILGEFLKALPITISAALLSSIFISLTIVPALTASFLAKRKVKNHKTLLGPLFDKLGLWFHDVIDKIIKRRLFRVLTIITALAVFAASMTLPITGALQVEMFPGTDLRYFIVNVETPKGLVIEETKKITEEVESLLYKVPEIESFLTIIGTGNSQIATDIVDFSGGGSSNLANITINLTENKARERKSYEIAEEVREMFKDFQKAKVTITELSEGPPSDAPVVLRMTGNDLKKIQTVSKDIEKIFEKTEGTENVRSDFEPGLNEFKFTLDREILAQHGLSGFQVSAITRNIINGIEATETKFGDEDLEVIVRYDLPIKNNTAQISLSTIENIEIPTPQGYNVSLSQLGDISFEQSNAAIQREDQKKIIKIRSDLKEGITAIALTEKLENALESYEIPEGINVRFGGDTEDIDESFQDLFRSMIVGLILIAFTLVLMFNSLKQPFIILLTLPLALIGVFPGLLLVGLNLSFPAFLGVVALTGVVVNDAIVLIDRINKNRQSGMKFEESISEAANARLQPIIMTTITTVVGILPLALTNEFWAGLGFSLIFGLTTATSLTLVVMPVLYHMFEGRKALKAEGKTN